VPFEVRLVDPRPSTNLSSIGSDATKEMEESAKLALNSDLNSREVCGVVGVGVSAKSR